MKLLSFKLSAIVISFCTLLSSCVINNNDTIEKNTPTSSANDSIVLVERYLNYANGYQDSGCFIDLKGYVYEFDFSTYNYDDNNRKEGDEFINALEEIQDNTTPVRSVTSEKINECFCLIEFIDQNAEITREHNAYDAGQVTLYAYDNSTSSLIMLSSYGDYTEKLNDKYSEKIVNIYNKFIDK